MGYQFPDTEKALQEVMQALNPATPVKLWLNAYDADAFHVITLIGGSETGPLRMDRLQVDSYGPGRDAAKDLSDTVRLALADRSHQTEAGLIDSVDVELVPRQMPIVTERFFMFSALYRVHTRAV